jgi:hypothetical protein
MLSTYSSQSQGDSFALGFAMRLGVDLDALIIHSAVIDCSDGGSIESASSYMNRRELLQKNSGTRHPLSTSKVLSPPLPSSSHSTLQQSTLPVSHQAEQKNRPIGNQNSAHASQEQTNAFSI